MTFLLSSCTFRGHRTVLALRRNQPDSSHIYIRVQKWPFRMYGCAGVASPSERKKHLYLRRETVTGRDAMWHKTFFKTVGALFVLILVCSACGPSTGAT